MPAVKLHFAHAHAVADYVLPLAVEGETLRAAVAAVAVTPGLGEINTSDRRTFFATVCISCAGFTGVQLVNAAATLCKAQRQLKNLLSPSANWPARVPCRAWTAYVPNDDNQTRVNLARVMAEAYTETELGYDAPTDCLCYRVPEPAPLAVCLAMAARVHNLVLWSTLPVARKMSSRTWLSRASMDLIVKDLAPIVASVEDAPEELEGEDHS